MVCLFVTLFLACVASLLACPEPVNVHIKNYEGPIILHTASYDNQQPRDNCNQQPGNYGNQYKKHGCCETECTCVSKQNYAPYAYGVSVASNSGCCPVADAKPLVYCVCNSCGSNGYSNSLCDSQGYQCYPNCQGKKSSCC